MQTTRQQGRAPERSARLPYSAGLDGLRALAVIAVLVYHAEYSALPGGFLGVEIFFVISGYLITSLLLKEWRQDRGINLPAFWLRRARRLLPALFLLLVATLAYAVFFLPDEVAALRSDALAATFYVTNWYYIFAQMSYFEAVGRPSLFRHLWSLAIEEQFYVLWPIFLTLMLRRLGARRVLGVVTAMAAASAVLMAAFFVPNSDPSRVYYGTDTRAAGLLFGAALAFVWASENLPRRLDRLPYDLIGLGALGVLVYFCLRVNQFQASLYQGGFAILDIATVVLIAVTVHPRARLGPLFLGREPLRWIGLRSYGIYLWHWPVFMITRPQLDVPIDGWPLLVLRLAATFILAELSYRFVEMPIRSGGLGRAWQALRQTRGAQKRRLALQWSVMTTLSLASFMALGAAVVDARPPARPEYLAVESVNTVGSVATPTVADLLPSSTPAEVLPAPTSEAAATAEPSPTPEPVATDMAGATAEPSPTSTPEPAATEMAIATAQAAATTAVPTPLPSRPPATPTETEIARERPVLRTPTASPPSPLPASTPAAPRSPTPVPTCVPAVGGSKVTAIGDSVMIGAAAEMQKIICNIEVDASQGRLVPFAVDAVREHRAAGDLGQVVVIQMGNNGVIYASQFDAMMAALADARRVVVINVKVPREYEAQNNAVIAEGVKRYKNAVLIDWYGLTAKRPDLFWSDGMHLRPEGARFFAELVAAAVK